MIMLVPWTIVNAIDIVVIFLLAHAIVKKKPVLTVNRVLIGVAYALILGVIGTVFDDAYIYRIATTILDILIIYFIVKKPLSSALIVYAMFWGFVFVQLPLGLVFQLIGFENMPLFIAVQFSTLIVAVLVCKFLPLNKLFRFLEEHLVLKLIFFILMVTCLAIAFYLNFEYDVSSLIFWSGTLIIGLIIIFQITKRIIYLRHTIPLRHNDTYHTTLGLLVKAYQEEDMNQIKELEKELQTNHSVCLEFDYYKLGKAMENIIAFIESKQDNIKAEIKHSIRYRQSHPRVGIETIIKLLSILLDNAIESNTNKPIVVDLGVNESHVQLSVKNEFKLKDPEGINRILMIDGYTTKKVNQRGYGLTNLHLELKQIGGELTTSYKYNQDGKAYYLDMTVNIIG